MADDEEALDEEMRHALEALAMWLAGESEGMTAEQFRLRRKLEQLEKDPAVQRRREWIKRSLENGAWTPPA